MSGSAPFETVVEKIATGGRGLARAEGEILFLGGVLPGERLRARKVRRRGGAWEGEVVEILEPSPDRVMPPEGPPGRLVGADFAHMSLAAQHEAKREIVRDCFSRIGRSDLGPLLEGPESVGPPWGYRNKIGLHGDGRGRYGMLRPGSRDLVLLDRHHLLPDLFHEEVLPLLGRLPPAERADVRFDGRGRFLLSLEGGDLRARAVGAAAAAPIPPSCAGVISGGRAVHGDDHLEMEVAGRLYRVHGRSFFQVNTGGAGFLVRLLDTWLREEGVAPETPGAALLDLYGGVGLFAAALAGSFERTTLVESDGAAVGDARENTRRAALSGTSFEVLRSPTEEALRRWTEEFPFGDPGRATAVVDPPRAGLAPAATRALGALRAARVFYVSCDPATLARDCRVLGESGYRPVRARIVDMFPQTSHVETVVELRLSGRPSG